VLLLWLLLAIAGVRIRVFSNIAFDLDCLDCDDDALFLSSQLNIFMWAGDFLENSLSLFITSFNDSRIDSLGTFSGQLTCNSFMVESRVSLTFLSTTPDFRNHVEIFMMEELFVFTGCKRERFSLFYEEEIL
jgi:hypothetical protein